MACTHNHGEEQLAPERKAPKAGPARMRTRQLEYARALRAPMAAIRAEARRGIVERGIFDDVVGGEQLAPKFDPDDLTPDGFSFDEPDTAHDRFMEWLNQQVEDGVLVAISRNDNIYVRRALSDGDRWAIARLREAGQTVEATVTPPEAYAPENLGGGTLQVSFDRPMPASNVRLLFQRNFDLLEGITSDMSKEIGRVLSEGFGQGKGPRDIARTIADRVDSVGRHRATLMARHEVMYAHNESTKHRYRDQGVKEVKVLGSSPCPKCEPFVDKVYPINDIPLGGPPFHPQCVGALAPAV